MIAPPRPSQAQRTEPQAPAVAGKLASALAELAIQVEADCQAQGCAADCELARAARRVAVSAAALAHDWATEAAP
jgi:hypothetical protein